MLFENTLVKKKNKIGLQQLPWLQSCDSSQLSHFYSLHQLLHWCFFCSLRCIILQCWKKGRFSPIGYLWYRDISRMISANQVAVHCWINYMPLSLTDIFLVFIFFLYSISWWISVSGLQDSSSCLYFLASLGSPSSLLSPVIFSIPISSGPCLNHRSFFVPRNNDPSAYKHLVLMLY